MPGVNMVNPKYKEVITQLLSSTKSSICLLMRKTLVFSFRFIIVRNTKYHAQQISRRYTALTFSLRTKCGAKQSAKQLFRLGTYIIIGV